MGQTDEQRSQWLAWREVGTTDLDLGIARLGLVVGLGVAEDGVWGRIKGLLGFACGDKEGSPLIESGRARDKQGRPRRRRRQIKGDSEGPHGALRRAGRSLILVSRRLRQINKEF